MAHMKSQQFYSMYKTSETLHQTNFRMEKGSGNKALPLGKEIKLITVGKWRVSFL